MNVKPMGGINLIISLIIIFFYNIKKELGKIYNLI